MKNYICSLVFAIFCLPNLILGQQNIQWAHSVRSFSSEQKNMGSPGQYAAKCVLGPPNVLVTNGPTPCAWSPAKENREAGEYIEVGFESPMQISQVAISEVFNPGAIFQIFLIDTAENRYRIYQKAPAPIAEKGRLFSLQFPLTPYKVKALRLELLTDNVRGYNQIDAIAIARDSSPIEIKINTIEGFEAVKKPENLGPNINSPYAEFAPQISPDGRTLYFTRQLHPQNVGNKETQDIWYSHQDSNGVFMEALNIGAPINTAGNNAICAVTPDGLSLLITNKYLPGGKSEKGVSLTYKLKDGWAFPISLDIDSFYNNNRFGEYYLASDGQTMVMTIERNEGEGGKDIHVSFRKEDGTWTVPKNIGNKVNTPDSEVSPFLAADGKTLYFATAGHPGYGDLDMFVTRRLDDSWTNWSPPLNLGPKLNTSKFDAYYSVPAKGDYAYYTTFENKGMQSDIMRVELPQSAKPAPVLLVYGKVLNAETKEPVGAIINYESLTTGTSLGIARSDMNTGDYRIILTSGDNYGFLATAEGFISESENIDLTKETAYRELRVDLKLVPIKKGNNIRLNNVFFDYNKYSLRPEARPELERVAKLMKTYPTLHLEIAGHTDDTGSDATNQVLSNNRAKAVYDFLIDKGTEKERLRYKGYGESKPAATNETEEGRAFNRRIEMGITSY